MCSEAVLIPIPDFIRADSSCFYGVDATHPEYGIDPEGRECFRIDACIAPTLLLLWSAKVKTKGCCCGHGSGSGVISLATPEDADAEAQRQQWDRDHPRDAVLRRMQVGNYSREALLDSYIGQVAEAV